MRLIDRETDTRRSLLRTCGLLSVAALAGCSSQDTDDNAHELEEDRETGNTRSGETAGHVEAYESYLAAEEIAVIDLQVDDSENKIALDYESDHVDDQFALADEIGVISGGFMNRLEENWEKQRLDATVYEDSTDVATWHMKREWFTEFQDGELSPDDLSLKILDTVDVLDE